MGVTTKYQLPWPAEAINFLKDGANAIRSLAEAVEAAMLPPLLVTSGDGSTVWSAKVAEIGWNSADDADRRRGSWDSVGAADQLLLPTSPGWYFVAATVRFGGKAEPDWYDLQIRTRTVGSAIGSGTKWAGTRTEQPANSTSYTELSVAGMVRVPTTSPATGICIRAAYNGANNPPDVGADVNKLSVHRWSAL